MFNTNFSQLFGQVAGARVRPSNLWSGDDQIQGLVEQLSTDAGFEAVRIGELGMASTQEGLTGVLFGIIESGLGPFVYRMASPEAL